MNKKLLLVIVACVNFLSLAIQAQEQEDQPVNYEHTYTPIKRSYVEEFMLGKQPAINSGAGLPIYNPHLYACVTCPKPLSADLMDADSASEILEKYPDLNFRAQSIRESVDGDRGFITSDSRLLLIGASQSEKQKIALALAKNANMPAYIYKGSEIAGTSPTDARLNLQRIFIEFGGASTVFASLDAPAHGMIIIDGLEKLLHPVDSKYVNTSTVTTLIYLLDYFAWRKVVCVMLLDNSVKLPEQIEMILAGYCVPDIYFV